MAAGRVNCACLTRRHKGRDDGRDEAAEGRRCGISTARRSPVSPLAGMPIPSGLRTGDVALFTSFDAKTGVGNRFGGPRMARPHQNYCRRLPRAVTHLLYASTAPGSVFREEAGPAGVDIGMLMMGSERRSEPLIQTEFSVLNRKSLLTGDGWRTNSTYRPRRDYVRPFPDVNAGLWQVSTSGGIQPAWTRNGRELFYRTQDGALMAVPIEVEPDFLAGAPTMVLEGRHFGAPLFERTSVSPDGKRFLMITRGGGPGSAASPPSITVGLNWGSGVEAPRADPVTPQTMPRKRHRVSEASRRCAAGHVGRSARRPCGAAGPCARPR